MKHYFRSLAHDIADRCACVVVMAAVLAASAWVLSTQFRFG